MNIKTICVTFLFSINLISCDNAGFSQQFKVNFKRNCVKQASVNILPSQAKQYCDCVLGVVMTKYDSDSEADRKMLNMSINDMTELVEPCQGNY
jgi:hypothetical protein